MAPLGHAPWVHGKSDEQSSSSALNPEEERNKVATRDEIHLAVDLDVHLTSPKGIRLKIHVDQGLYLTYPAHLWTPDHGPGLRTALTDRLGTPLQQLRGNPARQ